MFCLGFMCTTCRYPALRIAYIDEKEVQLPNGKIEKQYYSVLVKGDDEVLNLH
jgi:callose synthase